MKRFYETVGTEAAADGWRVTLDGRPMSTPARKRLVLPSGPLASAVAGEWRSQGRTIETASMPLTRLATTATDLMPARRGDAVEEIAGYAATDLLCYRTDAPADLARRQDTHWQPWLDWAERELGVRLVVTRSLEPVPQPEASLQAVRDAVEALDDWRLVGAHAATTLCGSVLLGLAIERGALAAGPAFEASVLDELYEIGRWGEEELQRQRHARLRDDLEAAARFLELLGT